ncbi:DUF5067 domain-containing protein [Bifidobacterium psychraerophilum]|jgi:hypothetical protein|uniref:DUF5067 domain-containing protein n=1 Tax=Bifidobacterium psychraerophilum TaxID=218140 RepID=UPI0023F4329B|nr:DUF5067 domain-containing protein [Bifidobacterium psychraerophilum]MCI1660269.1 DUF5067 domain-containing protein [Bifidobacterium psychraerophilum]MCI1803940.1 DUF5067 domain-containing protein [Bifidobacterium psychraerophilum]MCI2175762.1 DUF5067 domain-containing protein [Bifidobacterium psychraerophilum]MCI2182512.1 DUF5067 domain-containing protein [Bifidobacterium psychraerophilum]
MWRSFRSKGRRSYDGKPTVIVTYEWTNTGDDAVLVVAFDSKTFQNRASLDTAVLMDALIGVMRTRR